MALLFDEEFGCCVAVFCFMLASVCGCVFKHCFASKGVNRVSRFSKLTPFHEGIGNQVFVSDTRYGTTVAEARKKLTRVSVGTSCA